MSSLPKISVLTPTYNCGQFLERTYQSLCLQTEKNWEWLVVDDGSTDDTENIVKNFKDDRIHYIKLPKNMGRGTARVTGLEQAKGDYIAVWDADDIYAPTRFETALKGFEKHPESDFFCSYTGILDNNLIFQYPRGWLKDAFYKKYFVHHTLIARTQVMKNIGYPKHLRVGEDFSLVMTLAANHTGIYHEDVLAFYLESREVSALKALKANVAQFWQFIQLYATGILSHSFWKFVQVSARLCLKISVIGLMCLYPPVYLHTVKRRNKMIHLPPSENTKAFLQMMRQAYPPESA